MALSDNFKRGTIELLLLTLLQEDDKYGYQLATELATRSEGQYSLKESSLYPPLYRMVDKGLITSRDELVNRRVRVYYHIEPAGQEYLMSLRKDYLTLLNGTLKILGLEEAFDVEYLNQE